MSFFRNIRSSISRGKSSSRDTTPVRNSRPSSVIGSTASRRDSLDSHTGSQVFHRSETFILGDEHSTDKSAPNSNCSTLEKKSKKSKVFGKFSTFTKRKKTPSTSSPDNTNLEHHPSDNATNTYYNWQCDGGLAIDYDAQTDPFNFLYDQQSTLKALQQASASSRNNSFNSNSSQTKDLVRPKFDSSTFRKKSNRNLSSYPLKEQMEDLKTLSNEGLREDSEQIEAENEVVPQKVEEENEAEKYKTITLNSFRKSFRDHFLEQQQKDKLEEEALQKPAWFVKVEVPKSPRLREKYSRDQSKETKENRTDYLVFANENYRPGSRSPVRNERPSRSKTRSPVKRNETFRIENPQYGDENPSIQIAFRNSITSQTPVARIVPVGVAKPMPTTDYYKQRLAATTKYASSPEVNPVYKSSYPSPGNVRDTFHHSPSKASKSPLRNFFSRSQASSPSPTPLRHKNSTSQNQTTGRFQTLVHINNDNKSKTSQCSQSHHNLGPFATRNSSTKVQVNSNNPPHAQHSNHYQQQVQQPKVKTTLHNDYHSSLARLSYANIPAPNKSYDLNGRPVTSSKGQGSSNVGSHMAATISSANKRQTMPFGSGYIAATPAQGKAHYQNQGRSNNSSLHLGYQTQSANLYPNQNQQQHQHLQYHQQHHNHQHQHQHQKQHLPLHQNHSQQLFNHQQQSSPVSQKSRIMVSMQRRSRSPIKMPWR